ATTDSASSQYILTKSTAPGGESGTGSSSTVAVLSGNVAELDFDLTAFNKPRTVKGTAICSFSIYATTNVAQCKLQLRKWDGSSETEIANSYGITYVKRTGGVNTYGYAVDAIEVVVPPTIFKEGETLRVTLEQWGTSQNVPVTANWFIGHDPQSRATSGKEDLVSGAEGTFGTDPSISTVQLPIKLEV
ncbi:hypothetical protein LCGC14_2619180, partial [marine sediment metagenome]